MRKNGFELIIEKDEQIIARNKVALLDYLANLETEKRPINLSSYLSEIL